MKYAIYFFVLGCLSIWGAVGSGTWLFRGLCIFSALSFALMAVAFALKRVELLGKRSDGHIIYLAWAILWPYRFVNYLLLLCYKVFSRKTAISEIVPGLYLGRQLTFDSMPIEFVGSKLATLDLTAEFSEIRRLRQSEYYCIPVLDTMAPSLQDLKMGVQWMTDRLNVGNVFVHCALGTGRSALFVAAYLIDCGMCKSPEDAIAYLQTKRSEVRLSYDQQDMLLKCSCGA